MKGQNGVEFHRESNAHGPKHVTCVPHVSTSDLVTPDPIEVRTSVRGQNVEEFYSESNGYGVRHMRHVLRKYSKI